ncbi:MAG: hypothetical protein QM775_18135 [Pirellulales bacterium]
MNRIVEQTQGSTISFRRSIVIALVAMLFGFGVNVALEALGAFGDRPATLVRSVLLFFTVYFALTLQHCARCGQARSGVAKRRGEFVAARHQRPHRRPHPRRGS